MVVTEKKLGLVWGCFWLLPLSLPSSLTWSFSSLFQSDDIGNSFRHVLPSGVHITQHLEYLVIFAGASGEVGEGRDGVSISWFPCMGARLVDVLYAVFLASWIKLLLMVDSQFCWMASGSFPTFILLVGESWALFGLVSGTRLCFFAIILGFCW